MKAKDLRDRATADLQTLRDTMKKDLFSHRMKNLTNQLDDTSLLRKTQKDIARIESILSERQGTGLGVVEKGSEP
jgi:large subunit ribosomal protein L29